MNRLAIVGSILFSFWAMSDCFAQQSSLQVRSTDSIPFFLMLSGQQINDSALITVRVDSIKTKEYPVDILFADSTTHFSATVELEVGMLQVYEIQSLGSDFALLPFSRSKLETTSSAPIDAVPELSDVPAIAGDSLQTDSIDLPGYNGPRGCEGLMNSTAYEELTNDLKNEFFESRRKKRIAQEAKENCLSVEQFDGLLDFLELEDYKLEIMLECKAHLYDQGNLEELAGQLQFDRSREKWLAALKK